MDKIVAELKKICRFKDTTGAGDIVLIVAESPHAILYGVVAEMTRDVTRKDEWWHVTMHLLAIPTQKVTWTLRTEQFTGQEIFTMGGEKRFIKAIDMGEPGKKPVTKKKKAAPTQLRIVK